MILPFLPLPLYYSIAISAAAIFFLGFFDDSSFVHVRVRHKLVTEFALATIIVLLFKIPQAHAMILSVPIPAWIVVPVAILWLVGLMNAINIIDGVDGLAGGLAIISFIALLIFAAQLKETAAMGLCLVLAGATVGFLVFNVSPARVFLGDTGSLFLGAMLGTLTLYSATVSYRSFSRPVLFLLVAVPVVDVFVAIVRRYFKARDRRVGFLERLRSVTMADNNHIHHRLITRGFSHSQTTLLLCSFSALLCLGGLLAWYVPVWLKFAVLIYTCLCVVFFLARLSFGGRFRKIFKTVGMSASSKISPLPNETQQLGALLVGVIDPKGLVYRCLCRFEQKEFAFVNLSGKDWQTYGIDWLSAMVIRSIPDSVLANDLKVAQGIAGRHKCPVIIISEKAGLEITVSVPDSQPICYRKMPISIPKIIEDLKEIKRDVTSIPALSPDEGKGNDSSLLSSLSSG
jgi:UDP-GlcNAc:undecaprenyl-phosphate GlcNAc-1-phosphate transferase